MEKNGPTVDSKSSWAQRACSLEFFLSPAADLLLSAQSNEWRGKITLNSGYKSVHILGSSFTKTKYTLINRRSLFQCKSSVKSAVGPTSRTRSVLPQFGQFANSPQQPGSSRGLGYPRQYKNIITHTLASNIQPLPPLVLPPATFESNPPKSILYVTSCDLLL